MRDYFEGTEKKFELLVAPEMPPLREMGDEYWAELVKSSGAQILSKISSKCCDAYLLSESSLFVFDHRLTMITCGKTSLIDAIFFLLNRFEPKNFLSFQYERKNENFPHEQLTHFYDDIQRLNQKLPGNGYRFGNKDEHHVHIFDMKTPYKADPNDKTLEILMHGIDDKSRKLFCDGDDRTLGEIHHSTMIHQIFPDFKTDEYIFMPNGYSMNAIKDDEYYTFHITPEDEASYVSFETNHKFENSASQTLKRVLEIFNPRSFDIVQFQFEDMPETISGYVVTQSFEKIFDSGFQVQFASYTKKNLTTNEPFQYQF